MSYDRDLEPDDIHLGLHVGVHPVDAVERESARLLGRATRVLAALAASTGFDVTGLRCVLLLNRQGPMPIGRLATLSGLPVKTISTVADRLERDGLISRRRDPGERRVLLHADPTAYRARVEPALRELKKAWYALIGPRCDDLNLISTLLAEGRRLTELVPPPRYLI
ncbi:MAG TPA: MarR family transcriptional regulator [Thermopolyspora sp.]|jgi:MarR family.